ncbi:hypothetical protein SAMN04487970_102123 [Paenibacillus tianmuensis]|uniref:Uncharacterized protein n=1 Tax=Paenibacillus tianmuensis TaxID=624147 RepID=A0A1G4RYK8_9BACL|nr:hypothetical protein [Paenibacillus tianmuensis]SCW62043.1 hypothetical protein SAMN04487970_102123 [Paenibacillus tianmuensis]
MRMVQEAVPFFVKIGLIARCRCVIVASAGRLVAYTVERNPVGRPLAALLSKGVTKTMNASPNKDGERLMKVETRLENIEVAVTRMEEKLDKWHGNYISRVEINEMLRARDERLERIEKERLANKQLYPGWISSLIAFAALLVAWFHNK